MLQAKRKNNSDQCATRYIEHPARYRAFTLIELMVVVAIISIISSVAFASFSAAKQRALVSKANSEVKQLQLAMEMYFNDRGDYPPFGAHLCSGCSNPPTSNWLTVVDELTPYMRNRLEKDSWGNYFAYDKNFKQVCWNAWSVLCSAGPNGIMETNVCQQSEIAGGDDICAFFPDAD